MSLGRVLFLAILVLGLAASAAFRSTGAVSEKDALVAAAAQGASILDPPLRLTTKLFSTFVQAARRLDPGSGLFPVIHGASGALLALAAAVTSCAAFAATRGGVHLRVAAGILTGAACLFGAIGVSGTDASAVPMLVLLLSGATLAWIGDRPRAATGGILLGLAVTEHPYVLLTLPGFLAMALGISVRSRPEDEARLFRRACLGFLFGLTAFFLAGSGVHSSRFGISAPKEWLRGLGHFIQALWSGVGPFGLGATLFGLGGFFQGQGRRVRPFFLIHLLLAAAMIFARPQDPEVLAALTVWSLLYSFIPAVEAASLRLPARRSSAIGAFALVSSAFLFLLNQKNLDRTREHGIDWARDSFDRLTENGLLLTANPVHWALAADLERADLAVVYVDEPATLKLRRSPLGLFAPDSVPKTLDPQFLRRLIEMNLPHRSVFFEPTLFFRNETREAILGSEYSSHPFGLAFRIARRADKPTPVEVRASTLLWDGYDIHPETPVSSLRGGLTGNQYYARSLLQSGALYLEAGLTRDAEREFIFVLSNEDGIHNLAAMGLGRVFFDRQRYADVVEILAPRIRNDREGAWIARKVLASAQLYSGNFEDARRNAQDALRLCPPQLAGEISSIRDLLVAIEKKKQVARPAAEPAPIPEATVE
jgi:hypothetical protein